MTKKGNQPHYTKKLADFFDHYPPGTKPAEQILKDRKYPDKKAEKDRALKP